MRLSKNFTLAELTRTSHRTIDNTPPPEIIERLERLAVDFLQPVRNQFGALWPTSGYRCPELNAAIGGSKTSAHMFGCAVDFVPLDSSVSTRDIVLWIVNESGLAFDQVIDEYSSTSNWVHLGAAKPGRKSRREALTMRRGAYSIFV